MSKIKKYNTFISQHENKTITFRLQGREWYFVIYVLPLGSKIIHLNV